MVQARITTTGFPWKDASNGVANADLSAAFYVKCIADVGQNGGQVTQSTIQVATAVDTITLRTAEGGALAADGDVDSYTAASGANGTITTVDANANSIGEIINCINGVGLGQTAFRRYRAALADFPPPLATVASDILVMGQTNIMLGENHPGLRVPVDASNVGLIAANDIWVGIGTTGGTIRGTGWTHPDYFEDIPGGSTTASVNTPVRSSAINARKTEDAVTRRKQFRVTGFAITASFATTANYCIHDINNNVLWIAPLTAGAVTLFQDLSQTPIVGPVGSPLFFRFWGTGALTDGSVHVRAEERFV